MSRSRSISARPDVYARRRAAACAVLATLAALALYLGTYAALAVLVALGWHA